MSPRILLVLALSFANTAPATRADVVPASAADPAGEVERLIARGAYGRRPVLWFARDPERNLGAGPELFAANSGGRLEARGEDPWGRARAAFGPLDSAAGGVAVAGSTAHAIFSPDEGTVLFFFRPAAARPEPMLLFSRGDWGGDNFFSLRVQPTRYGHGLMLALADPRVARRARQISRRWRWAAGPSRP